MSQEKKNIYDDYMFDYTLKDKRIELISTDDPYTRLKSGDRGTIEYQFKNLNEIVIQVKWDSGSNLGLIVGKDSYRILDKKDEEEEKPRIVAKIKGKYLVCPNCSKRIQRYYRTSIVRYEIQKGLFWVKVFEDENTREDESDKYYWCQNCDLDNIKLPEEYPDI